MVLAPALDLLYWAEKGGGAWREDKERCARAHLLRAAGAGHAARRWSRAFPIRRPELEEYLQTIPVARAGQGRQLAQVLLGRRWHAPTSIPRLGPTMEWDVAAGDCVYRQSGRHGERPSPLTYNKPDLRNPSFVIGL